MIKKALYVCALIIGATTTAFAVSNSTSTEGQAEMQTAISSESQVQVYSAKAVKNPAAAMKIATPIKYTWDGSYCYVIAKGGHDLAEPIQAEYTREYPGYPWKFQINNEVWYFNQD